MSMSTWTIGYQGSQLQMRTTRLLTTTALLVEVRCALVGYATTPGRGATISARGVSMTVEHKMRARSDVDTGSVCVCVWATCQNQHTDRCN